MTKSKNLDFRHHCRNLHNFHQPQSILNLSPAVWEWRKGQIEPPSEMKCFDCGLGICVLKEMELTSGYVSVPLVHWPLSPRSYQRGPDSALRYQRARLIIAHICHCRDEETLWILTSKDEDAVLEMEVFINSTGKSCFVRFLTPLDNTYESAPQLFKLPVVFPALLSSSHLPDCWSFHLLPLLSHCLLIKHSRSTSSYLPTAPVFFFGFVIFSLLALHLPPQYFSCAWL